MKFLKYTLSDWETIYCGSDNYYNIYRRDPSHYLYIGFNIITDTCPLEKRKWLTEIMGVEDDEISRLFYSTFDHKRRYVHSELAQGLKDIDKFLIRINRLKMFT